MMDITHLHDGHQHASVFRISNGQYRMNMDTILWEERRYMGIIMSIAMLERKRTAEIQAIMKESPMQTAISP